uniref:Uncharacterized protein n=1 Tax=Leersia perrieri TaxID=77586 RepID=A0A0D9XQI5_9ORYZ
MGDNPPGYFVGRPLNHEEQQPSRPVDEQNDQIPGYYKGHPVRKTDAQGEQKKEPGFFKKLFGCFTGGKNVN